MSTYSDRPPSQGFPAPGPQSPSAGQLIGNAYCPGWQQVQAAHYDFIVIGTGPAGEDRDWKSGAFELNGQAMDYYDYVRARLGGGKLAGRPVSRAVREGRPLTDGRIARRHGLLYLSSGQVQRRIGARQGSPAACRHAISRLTS